MVFYVEILRPQNYSNARPKRTTTGHTYSAEESIIDSHHQNRDPITSNRKSTITINRPGHTKRRPMLPNPTRNPSRSFLPTTEITTTYSNDEANSSQLGPSAAPTRLSKQYTTRPFRSTDTTK